MESPNEFMARMMDGKRLQEILNSQEFQQFAKDIRYSRFDPQHTSEEMQKKFNISKPSRSNTSLDDDVFYLVQLFLNKGNNIYAILKKTPSKDRSRVSNLQRKYGIVPSAKNDASAITLGRIVSAFPLITAKVLVSTPDDQLHRPFSANKMKTFIAGYPKVLMCHAIASVIPKSLDKEIVKTIKFGICCYTAIETTIINKDFKQNLFGAAAKCKEYVDLSHDSSLLSEETRMAACKDQDIFGEVFIYSSDGEINSATAPVKTAAEFYTKFLDKEFTYDDLQQYL